MKNSRFSKKYRGETCLNCGTKLELSDQYCPGCGQLNTRKKLSFSDFFYEFFGNLISYDSRFYRTLKVLISRPGKISKEYIQGKRARYVNPFRFYLSVSIVYFILNGFMVTNEKDHEILDISFGDAEELSDTTQVNANYYSEKNLDSLGLFDSWGTRFAMYYNYYERNEEKSPEKALKTMEHDPSSFNKWVYRKSVQSKALSQDPTAFINYSISKIPFFLFFLLPVFALFVWLFFRKSKFSYAEHLVFTFHTQTMLFVLFVINALIGIFVQNSIIQIIATSIFVIYLYKALRNFYGQKRVITILKFLGLNFIFILLVSFTILLALAASFAIY